MTAKEITRLAVYGIAAVLGGVITVLAYLAGDIATMGVAMGWIVTNVLAGVNIGSTSTDS